MRPVKEYIVNWIIGVSENWHTSCIPPNTETETNHYMLDAAMSRPRIHHTRTSQSPESKNKAGKTTLVLHLQ